MTELLEDAGFDVLAACDGSVAVDLLQSTRTVDLVLSDINMPGLDGYGVALKAREHHPDALILLVSGRHELLDRQAEFADYEFLPKPFRLQQLLDTVHRLLPHHPH